MIQAALGGYGTMISLNGDPAINTLTDAPNAFYEPGFNIFSSSLTLSAPSSDKLFVLFRRRTDEAGITFSTSDTASQYFVTVRDATNGNLLPATLLDSLDGSNWFDTDTGVSPVILFILTKPASAVLQDFDKYNVREVDCLVTYKPTSDAIRFSISIMADNPVVTFLYVDSQDTLGRPKSSSSVLIGKINLGINGGYTIITPNSPLFEVDSKDSDAVFSYPVGRIYYSRANLTNDEDFVFSVSSSSHDFISQYVSVQSVPNFAKVGILILPAGLTDKIFNTVPPDGQDSDVYWVEIKLEGLLTKQTSIYRFYLVPKITGPVVIQSGLS